MLPYSGFLEARDLTDINMLVVHCTELPDLAAARKIGEDIRYAASGTGNSGHFYIDRNGAIEQWVPENRVAHHVRNYNRNSLGIELVNLGRYPDWFDSNRQEMTEPYSRDQVRACVALICWLEDQLPSLNVIAGHEDLDQEVVPASDDAQVRVRRKRDPGPLFPWQEVMAACTLTRRSAPTGNR